MSSCKLAVALVAWVLFAAQAPALAQSDELRVCADPNNLPFSNRAGEGFENKLAELIAAELDRRVVYTWRPQRRGFIRNTLKAKLCDVIMGVPSGLDMVALTRPYYRSSYVFVTRSDRGLDLHSMTDPRLRNMKIGVHLIGDDGANAPPAHALGEQGIVSNVVGFSIYGDYRMANPPARLIESVESGEIDVAAAWGPLAGYFALHSPVPLKLAVITDTEGFAPLVFAFDIAMGLRREDEALRARIDGVLDRRAGDIRHLLESYGVPLEEPLHAPAAAAKAQDLD